MNRLLLLILLIVAGENLKSQSGRVDSTFGTGGRSTVGLGNDQDFLNKVLIQKDGKILLAGHASTTISQMGICRLNSNGSLDLSFGIGGKKLVFSKNGSSCNDVEILPNGKILLAGTSFTTSYWDYSLIRLHENGIVDSSFGVNGSITTPISLSTDEIIKIEVQSDGKIIAAGNTEEKICLVRYTSNGMLDSTFGNNGLYIDSLPGFSLRIAELKIAKSGDYYVGLTCLQQTCNFILKCIDQNGSLKSSFANNGTAVFDLSNNKDVLTSVNVINDGSILMVGYSDKDFALVKVKPDGSLDSSFGMQGSVKTHLSDDGAWPSDIAICKDGSVLVAGTSFSGFSGDFVAVQYNSNGIVDSTFGLNGISIFSKPGGETCISMVLQDDNKIILGGRGLGSANLDFLALRAIPANRFLREDFVNDRQNILLYPNPIIEHFCLDISATSNYPVNLDLIDMNGNVISIDRNFSLFQGESIFRIPESTTAGMYFLRITNGPSVYFKKVIVQ